MKDSKIINKIIITLVLITMVLSFFPVGSYAYKQDDIKVNVSVGFDGFYKDNYTYPMQITVENQYKDIQGKIQILFPDVYPNKELYTAYSKEIRLAKGSTKNFDFLLDRSNPSNNIKIRIINDDENIIWEEELKITSGAPYETVSIGVLSDDIESLNYLNLLLFPRFDKPNSVRASRIGDLTQYTPETREALEVFDMIIINNFDTEKLNNKQIKAIKEWTENGGILIIGTGANYQKTLKGLKDINYLEVKETEKIIGNSLFNSFNNNNLSNELLTVIKGETETGEGVLTSEGKTLVYKEKTGLGNTYIMAFDLGISPFIDWNGKEKFLKKLFEVDINNRNTADLAGVPRVQYGSFNRFENILRYVPMNKAISVKIILVIIGIFILLVGPINYIILKKLDLREKGWITIPAIVLVFTLFIYLWGFKTRFNQPLVNNISIINAVSNNDIAKLESASGVLGFENGDIEVELTNDGSLSVNNNNRHTNQYKFQDGDITIEYMLDNDKKIIFKNKGMWDIQMITTEDNINVKGQIKSNLSFIDGKMVGEIENLSKLDIEDAVLIYGDYSYKKIGDIQKDEKKSLDFTLTKSSNNNRRYYDLLDNLYPWGRKIDNKDILNDRVKREILEGFFRNRNMNLKTQKVMVIGWNKEPLAKELKVNHMDTNRLDRNLILIPITFNYGKGENIEIPYGIFQGQVLEYDKLNYEWMEHSFYGTGHVVYSLKPEIDMDIQEIKIDITRGMPLNSYNISIYNYESNTWDTYKKKDLIINDTNKDKYYSNTDGTKLKIEAVNNTRILSPNFSVKGVVK